MGGNDTRPVSNNTLSVTATGGGAVTNVGSEGQTGGEHVALNVEYGRRLFQGDTLDISLTAGVEGSRDGGSPSPVDVVPHVGVGGQFASGFELHANMGLAIHTGGENWGGVRALAGAGYYFSKELSLGLDVGYTGGAASRTPGATVDPVVYHSANGNDYTLAGYQGPDRVTDGGAIFTGLTLTYRWSL